MVHLVASLIGYRHQMESMQQGAFLVLDRCRHFWIMPLHTLYFLI